MIVGVRQCFFRAVGRLLISLCLGAVACVAALAQAPASPAGEGAQAPAAEATPTPEAIKERKIDLKNAAADYDEPLAETIPRVNPPLSLYECRLMLREAIETLERGRGSLSVKGRARYVDRVLHIITAYVDEVDRSYPTLPYYTWERIAAEKVPPAGWDTMVLKPRKPLANTTAVALRVRHGDVKVRKIVVIDKAKTRWEFNRELTVDSEQKRPEVFYLPMPTFLAEIHIDCQRLDKIDSGRPRLYVHAGHSKVPEWAKQAIFKMKVGREALKESKLGEASSSLRQAYTMLERYQKDRRF